MVQKSEIKEPLKFQPILQSRIWGGDGLYRKLRKGKASDLDIGESWELSDRADYSTVVIDGTFAGQKFKDLFARHSRDILGSQYHPSLATFPLLFKFIFAREPLSVQVHPGEGSSLGDAKTECWYILEAPPEGEIILGVRGMQRDTENFEDKNPHIKGEIDHKKTLAALTGKDCYSALNRLPVKAGDLFFIPAGTVHAITAGLLLFEVQQNSDTTFRLYDWDRVDANGKGRTLHIRESSEVIDFRQHDQHRIESLFIQYPSHREEFCIACEFFAILKYSQLKETISLENANRFRVLTGIGGSFELLWEGGGGLIISLGDTVLVPASCPNPKIKALEENSELLASFVPKIEEEIFSPLRGAGYKNEVIRKLGGLEGLAKF